MKSTFEVEVQIRNRLGLHARPAAHFVRCASAFAADVYVTRNGIEINGKSIMGVMMLAAEQGATLAIRAEGEDASKAVKALVDLIERSFDEDDEGRPISRGAPEGEH